MVLVVEWFLVRIRGGNLRRRMLFLNTEDSDFIKTGFNGDEVDSVAENLSFLLIDVDEFEFGFCLSEYSDLSNHKERPPAIWRCLAFGS